MIIQYSEGLPLLEANEKRRCLAVSSSRDREAELVSFYDRFLAHDIDYFAISRNYAPGIYELLELIEQGEGHEQQFIKGQTVGPITFAAAISDLDGKSVLHNPELLEAIVNGLSIKALWQVRQLGKSGRTPVIFLDEPYLSGFGSAFSPIQRHEVIALLQTVIKYLRDNSDTLIGIHCCGNTDWSMLIDADPDIINFDAFEFMDYFLLYSADILHFLQKGGTVAWGIIPTSNFTGNESAQNLLTRLEQGLKGVYEWGIDPEVVAERSILTPACGMGTMTPEEAKNGMSLLSRLSGKLRHL
ncbi:MAG: hypothetical protein IH593_09635 [Bacteroidales bacterium]|nr:hypothetical protein [Bacteroidales bacterium]